VTWVDRNEAWNRISVRYCDVTGQLLPRRYWYFEVEGRGFHVRDPHCEELYRTYVVPRRNAFVDRH
jgi:hypothetical protein